MLSLDNPFWRFSLDVYSAPGVAPECLALQEALGIDVNLLLFAAWAGAGPGVALTDDEFAAAEALVAEWRDQVVRPLRAARREIKHMALHAEPEVAEFRKAVAGVELDAERIEQALLWDWASRRWGEPAAPAPSRPVGVNIETCLGRSRAEPGAGGLRPDCLERAALAHRAEPSEGRRTGPIRSPRG